MSEKMIIHHFNTFFGFVLFEKDDFKLFIEFHALVEHSSDIVVKNSAQCCRRFLGAKLWDIVDHNVGGGSVLPKNHGGW